MWDTALAKRNFQGVIICRFFRIFCLLFLQSHNLLFQFGYLICFLLQSANLHLLFPYQGIDGIHFRIHAGNNAGKFLYAAHGQRLFVCFGLFFTDFCLDLCHFCRQFKHPAHCRGLPFLCHRKLLFFFKPRTERCDRTQHLCMFLRYLGVPVALLLGLCGL